MIFQNRVGREVTYNGWRFIFIFIKTRLRILNPVGIDCFDVDSYRELKKHLCTVHSRNKIECMASGRTFSKKSIGKCYFKVNNTGHERLPLSLITCSFAVAL